MVSIINPKYIATYACHVYVNYLDYLVVLVRYAYAMPKYNDQAHYMHVHAHVSTHDKQLTVRRR
jgi:hypothetical protein